MVPTVTRIPRMHGFPPMTAESLVILVNVSIATPHLQLYEKRRATRRLVCEHFAHDSMAARGGYWVWSADQAQYRQREPSLGIQNSRCFNSTSEAHPPLPPDAWRSLPATRASARPATTGLVPSCAASPAENRTSLRTAPG